MKKAFIYPAITDSQETRILGIDTSLRSTGLGVVGKKGNSMRALWHGTVKIATSKPLSEALLTLYNAVDETIVALSPSAVAIEGIFYFKYAQTAMLLGHARGVVIACCAKHGLPVYEYEPRNVKQAMTGYGAASKEQMQRMMMTMLKLPTLPAEDEGDALALAVCHCQQQTSVMALKRETL